MEELSLAVVGIDYPNADKSKSNRRFELLQCVPGEPVHLMLEPKNRHDANAVAVFSTRGIQLGYITAERAPFVGGRIRAGIEAKGIFQILEDKAAWIRLRFGGGDPTLPASNPAPASRKPAKGDDDFYPDPDGPEWGA